MSKPGPLPGLTSIVSQWSATIAHHVSQNDGIILKAEDITPLLIAAANDIVEHVASANNQEQPRALTSDVHSSSMQLAALLAALPIGIAIADFSGTIINTNPSLNKLLGYRKGELTGQNLVELGYNDIDQETIRAGLTDLITMNVQPAQNRVLVHHAVETPLWVQTTLAKLPSDRDHPGYIVLMTQDSNELQLLQERLRYQNIHDPLTGLPNTFRFKTQLETMLAGDPHEYITLIYLDIDGFKVINDGLGAGAGDRVLREVARKIASVVSTEPQHFVARLSGDGFAVLLSGKHSSYDATQLVEQIFAELAEPMYLPGEGVAPQGVSVSTSAGIVVKPVRDCVSIDLLRAAEIALHRAKEAGKAQWMLYDSELDAQDRSRYKLGALIGGALRNGEFSLIYQPTVKLTDLDELAAVNAGLQWNHPTLGTLDADEFYPMAEKTGMIVPLGRWLLKESLAATARWRNKFGELAPDVCIRLPKRLAIDPDLVKLIKEQLDEHELDARALRLCTDGPSIMDPRGEVLDSLSVLSDIGAQLILAVTGSADLELIPSYRLPVKHVILSATVINGIAGGDDDIAVRHLTQLITRARELKLRIGAEGVQSHAQAARLRELGVIAARGAFVTETATGDQVDQLIERHARR